MFRGSNKKGQSQRAAFNGRPTQDDVEYDLPRNEDCVIPDVSEIANSGWTAFYDLMRVPLPHAIAMNAWMRRADAPVLKGRPCSLYVIPARHGLLVMKRRPDNQFFEQLRFALPALTIDAVLQA